MRLARGAAAWPSCRAARAPGSAAARSRSTARMVLSVARMTASSRSTRRCPARGCEPGVLNLDLSVAVRHLGLHYAPDPSSQQACSIGGNVATNAGGPHCLASGVTSQHVLGMEIVLGDGEVLRLGGTAPDPPGYDLRGFVVGGEGTLGVVTEVPCA